MLKEPHRKLLGERKMGQEALGAGVDRGLVGDIFNCMITTLVMETIIGA